MQTTNLGSRFAQDEALLLQPEKQDSVDSDEYNQSQRQQQPVRAVIEQSHSELAKQLGLTPQQIQHMQSMKGQQRPSLAQSLRQRREFMEHIENEREKVGGGRVMKVKRSMIVKAPSQTDETGSAIRIRNQRPQTPRINLLKLKRKEFTEAPQNHPLFSQQAQLPKSKPFNYLNPNAKIGVPSLETLNTEPLQTRASKKSPKQTLKIKASAITRHEEESKVVKPIAMELENAANEDLNDRETCEREAVVVNERQQIRPPSGSNKMSESSYNAMALTNMQDQFMEIMNNEQVEDVIDLNEKFLAMALGGIEVSELALLPKLELRVDTTCHSLQVTGEILPSLEYLKLNDSIIRCFRDVGTSFKNVRVLHISRCELKEVQGIQAFEQLEELYMAHNAIEELFDVSLAQHLQVLDLEGNNVSSVDQLKYLRRMPRLSDLSFKQNPVAKEFAYHQKIAEVVPHLHFLDDEPIGDSFQEFVEEKQQDLRKMSMKTSSPASELFETALASVLAQFERLGLTRDLLLPENGETAESTAQSMQIIEQISKEPDDETLLATTIKNQNKDQKAQQSYEDNMDVQGFGSTFAGGFYQTEASGFGLARPQSALMSKGPTYGQKSALGADLQGGNTLMTEQGHDSDLDEEEERRAQLEFEQSMRATSMSFFKTAKSTFMSTNDLQSDEVPTIESYQAWGGQQVARGQHTMLAEEDECSDLAANTDQIMTGGTMSILRRKGKNFKDRRRDGDGAMKGANVISELLSNDISTLMQLFRDEANADTMKRDRSNEEQNETQSNIIRSKTTVMGSGVKSRPQSSTRIRPSSKQRNAFNGSTTMTQVPATSIKDPRLAAVASILEKKKVGGTGTDEPPAVKKGFGGIASLRTSMTMSGDKLSVEKLKRPSILGAGGTSGAPIKAKLMTVKLKPNQIAFKSTETKTVKKDE